MNTKDRPYILWEIERLQCPVINLSGENYGHGFIETQAGSQPRVTHFYMELFLFLLNRFQQKRFALPAERSFVGKQKKVSKSITTFFQGVAQNSGKTIRMVNHS
jgi:hypothetical protein